MSSGHRHPAWAAARRKDVMLQHGRHGSAAAAGYGPAQAAGLMA